MRTMRRGAMVAVVGAAAMCLALAACGQSTPIPSAKFQCGTVHEAAGRIQPADVAAATAAENCFAQHYATCSPADLGFTVMGVDTGATDTFGVSRSNGACAISLTEQAYTANGGGKTFPSQTFQCSGLRQEADGLHFTGCGQAGDVLVPAPAA